ncbi:MAG: PD-(D/E)XK nuclease family protein [bacterium]
MNNRDPANLLVYPTAVALRQAQRRALERDGFFDGRRHTTLSTLLRDCALIALARRNLRPIQDLDRELAIVEAVSQFRRTKPASRPAAGDLGQNLRKLAPSALEETLSQLIDTLSPLADRAGDFLRLLSADRSAPKNPDLAALYSAYATVCESLGVADEATLNAAILALLRGDRSHWPASLRQARAITFIAVRWVAPFQESVIHALAGQLGRDQVAVRHILADYEQDWWGGPLLTDTGRLLFGDAESVAAECEFQSASTRSAIEHLTSLREGYAMQDRALAEQARERVGFSCSVGVYGEIEDLARRIAWELHDRPDPLRPEDICLVTRKLGAASDAIMDVFARFNIPYYFRRGVPVLAVPVIKSLVDLARLSATQERDIFCALLQSPWLHWEGILADPVQLADDLLRSGVEPVMDAPDRMARRLTSYAMQQRRFAERTEAEAYGASAVRALQIAMGPAAVPSLDAGLADLISRCDHFKFADIQAPSGNDSTGSRAYLLNSKAWEAVSSTLDTLQRHSLVNRSTIPSMSWMEIVDLLNRALKNITVSPAPPDESGVWILNPYDMAGLSFKVVLMAGLNAGAFPKSPTPSPLFPDFELLGFRDRLMKKGPLPVAALAASKARTSQENLLFLTCLAASRATMVFSYAGHDETGQELTPSVFFSTLWRLVGWPAWPILPAAPPDPYDRWRLAKLPAHLKSHWVRHLALNQELPVIAAFKRRPFPGESYLGTIPIELCRGDDERRQRVAQGERMKELDPVALSGAPTPLALHIAHGIQVEHQRQAFFGRQSQEKGETPSDLSHCAGHEYAGVLDPALWAQIKPTPAEGILDLTPTQLERLIACPYQYYLLHILKVEPIEPNELEPSHQDFGTAIHAILHAGFQMLQGVRPDPALPDLSKLEASHHPLMSPVWAVPDSQGVWHLQETAWRPSDDALPLVHFPPDEKPVLAFFDDLTNALLDWATRGNAVWMLGAPEQLNVQRIRISRAVRALVRTAMSPEAIPEDAGLEQCRRFPALLEYTFNSRLLGKTPSLELTDPADPGHRLRLHGKIDRVDFIFAPDRTLRAAIVVDYKGAGKIKAKTGTLAEGILTGKDCQLPAYALAASTALTPSGLPPPESRIPLLMQYLSYAQPFEDMVKQSRQHWVDLDGRPGETADLAAAFTTLALMAANRYERGDFAVTPKACEYCDLKACCRHAASLLSSDTEDNGGDA